MTILEVLMEARTLIDTPEKWVKGIGRDEDRICLHTALRDAGHMTSGASLAFSAVCAALPEWFVRDSIIGFNDAPETKHADVLRVLDAAIARARR